MGSARRAVIDIGTNSVKLLVADVTGRSVQPIVEESEQTRLGRGFYDNHRLQPEAIADTAEAVAEFVRAAQRKGADSIRIIATSAARDAVNREDLLNAVRSACGLPVEVISGEQEAEWAYQGVRSNSWVTGERLLILDVGGGSSEFIIGQNHHPAFAASFPMGSVRLLELIRPSDPPRPEELDNCRQWLRHLFHEKIHPAIGPVLAEHRENTRLIGTGGAATILARMELRLDKYNRHAIEGACINRDIVERWTRQLWRLPLVKRRKIIGLPKRRADVILTGLVIYETVLHELGFTELHVSTRGLRFAALMDEVPSVTPA